MIDIEIAYATPEIQVLHAIKVNPGTKIIDVLTMAEIAAKIPIDINLNIKAIGVFGQIQTMDYVLQQGDRIEIYRNLNADPKQQRHRRISKIGRSVLEK